jgi:hypothetical protein
MLWAALGIVQPPAPDADVFGAADSARVIWRFARGEDTLTYVASKASARWLEAEWRRAGETIARARVQRAPVASGGAGHVSGARIDFPEAPARFELTVVAIDTAAVIPPPLWRGRR